jgi:hypothetical protein
MSLRLESKAADRGEMTGEPTLVPFVHVFANMWGDGRVNPQDRNFSSEVCSE